MVSWFQGYFLRSCSPRLWNRFSSDQECPWRLVGGDEGVTVSFTTDAYLCKWGWFRTCARFCVTTTVIVVRIVDIGLVFFFILVVSCLLVSFVGFFDCLSSASLTVYPRLLWLSILGFFDCLSSSPLSLLLSSDSLEGILFIGFFLFAAFVSFELETTLLWAVSVSFLPLGSCSFSATVQELLLNINLRGPFI